MRPTPALVCSAIAALALSGCTAAAPIPATPAVAGEPGAAQHGLGAEAIVTFRRGTPRETVERIADRIGTPIMSVSFERLVRIAIPARDSFARVKAAYEAFAEVEAIEENRQVTVPR